MTLMTKNVTIQILGILNYLIFTLGLFAFFAQIFGKKKSDYTMRNKELSLREDALDREATLMNVLKSVNQKSEPDLVEVTKETSSKSSGFNWFRSKSKENVLDQPSVIYKKNVRFHNFYD